MVLKEHRKLICHVRIQWFIINNSAANFGISSEVIIFMTSGHVYIRDSVSEMWKLFVVNCCICRIELSNLPSMVCSHGSLKASFTTDFSENRITCLLYMLLTIQFPSCFGFGYTYPGQMYFA